MPENKHLRFLLRVLYAALGLIGLWLALRFVLPWLLPFLLAFALAAALEPVVRFLKARWKLARSLSSALCVLVLSAALCGLLGLLAWRAWYEAGLLLERLPTLLSGLPALGTRLEDWLYRFTVALPVPLQVLFQNTLEALLKQGAALPDQLYDWLSGIALKAAAALPNIFLFLFTTLLSTYFISAGRPALLHHLERLVPERWHLRLQDGGMQIRETLINWLKAQGLLMAITFAELTAGFLILQIDLALLLAAVVAIVDALPVFGTGTVLIPWSLFAFLSGDRRLALGLLILYTCITLVRNILEPRLVGQQLGLHPLLALMAMYIGFQAFGVAGMILAPLAAVAGKGIWDCIRGRRT